MWAATHGVDVTNNSYFADPWYFNCRNDAEQRAIWMAERRAIKFAMRQGVTVVAAAANFADDLAHPTRDIISPDFPPGSAEERRIRNDCAVIPVEIPGVIGVSADGARQIKTWYSNYGSGVIQVTAPSTDRRLQSTPDFPNGRVVSTFPGGVRVLRRNVGGDAARDRRCGPRAEQVRADVTRSGRCGDQPDR